MPDDDGHGWVAEQDRRIEELIDAYRLALHDCLDGVTEEEARRQLVTSRTTLLGLLKHARFVEGVWFDQAITGRSYAEIGIAATVDGSFTLDAEDTIATVRADLQRCWATSRANLHGLRSHDVVDGRGERPVWALRLQVLRELAQHTGHADILREQVLTGRGPTDAVDGGAGQRSHPTGRSGGPRP